jgi:hypothetical protein
MEVDMYLKHNGYVLHEQLSEYDNSTEIFAVGTGFRTPSHNIKTGANVIQVTIQLKNEKPSESIKNRSESGICGECPHRPQPDGTRTCYVNMRSHNAIWKKYSEGGYPKATSLESLGRDRVIRLGSYGDPAMINKEVWDRLLHKSKGHMGYTHQWENLSDYDNLSDYCMASVETLDQKQRANDMGYRTFRVTDDLNTLQPDEIVCPASTTMGRKTTCYDCRLCAGAFRDRSAKIPNIVEQVHGSGAKHFTSLTVKETANERATATC